MKRPVDELDVFKPVPTSVKDENEYPIFPVNNVDIVSEETGKPANLLLAVHDNFVKLTGRVEQLDRQEKSHLIDRDSIPCNISVPHIDRFSYGQYDDGTVVFWAKGRAGWFEITPSRKYKPIYTAMTEATEMFYFISDFLSDMRTKKQQRRTSADTIMDKYAEDADNECEDKGEARRRLVRYREVLLSLMLANKENIGWKQTAIFKWLSSDDALEEPEDAEESKDTAIHTPQKPTEADSSDDELPAHLARKGKSALRPSTGGLGKGKGRASSKGPPIEDLNIDEDSDIDMPAATQTPTYAGQRRKSEDALDAPTPKRRRGRPPKNKPIEKEHAPPNPPPPYQEDGPAEEASLPLADRKPSQKGPPVKQPTARVEIKTTPLPSFEPNAPGDVWTCGFDGCSHKIFGASTIKSKALIEEHYKAHALESQRQIDLVYSEERPYLPVGNLISKIRDMAAKRQAGVGVEANIPPWKKEMLELSQGVKRTY